MILLLVIDSVQMTKVRYDENGLSQKIAEDYKNEGISANNILPNLESSWIGWYVFEEQMREEIKRVGGNKKLAGFPETNTNYRVLIVSKDNLKYQQVTADYHLEKIVPFKSLFVNSELFIYTR